MKGKIVYVSTNFKNVTVFWAFTTVLQGITVNIIYYNDYFNNRREISKRKIVSFSSNFKTVVAFKYTSFGTQTAVKSAMWKPISVVVYPFHPGKVLYVFSFWYEEYICRNNSTIYCVSKWLGHYSVVILPNNGLLKGNPLSLVLFILNTEALTTLIHNATCSVTYMHSNLLML